jgi:predicted nucleotidyltransferase
MDIARKRLQTRKAGYTASFLPELQRLKENCASISGILKVVLFGSYLSGNIGMTSDLDLLVVWDTPLDYLSRIVELYRLLSPRVPLDLLVYTPHEMTYMAEKPFIRKILAEGRIIYEK